VARADRQGSATRYRPSRHSAPGGRSTEAAAAGRFFKRTGSRQLDVLGGETPSFGETIGKP